MASLATNADLEARLGRTLTSAEQARATALLADASALIRGYTKQQYEAVADDTIVLRPVGATLRLPQRPVTAVSSVVAVAGGGGTDVTLSASEWTWDRIDEIELYPGVPGRWYCPAGWQSTEPPDTYRVTYSHGESPIPAGVVAVCCRMTLAALLAPTMAEGLVQERIGQYSYQYGQQAGSGSPGATVRMTETDRDDLKRYRRTAGTIQMRVD